MKVKDIMTKKKPVAVREDMTYEEVVRILHKHKISGAPVVNKKGTLVGLISEKDLFRAIHPSYKKFYERPEDYLDFESREEKVRELKTRLVNELMITDVITAHPDDPVLKIGALMLARGIHRLPVIQNKKIIGVVTRSRIYGNILKKHLDLSSDIKEI
jgi:CBS domain-containing protein